MAKTKPSGLSNWPSQGTPRPGRITVKTSVKTPR